MASDASKRVIEDALERSLVPSDPNAYVAVGYHNALHVTVVSEHFEGMARDRRYDEVLDVLAGVAIGNAPAIRRVSVCLLFTPEEYRETYGEERPSAAVSAAA